MKELGMMHPSDVCQPVAQFTGFAQMSSGVGLGFDVPAGALQMRFASNCDVFVRFGANGAPTLPAGNSSAGSTLSANGELFPAGSRLFNLISTASCTGFGIISPVSSGYATWSFFGRTT